MVRRSSKYAHFEANMCQWPLYSCKLFTDDNAYLYRPSSTSEPYTFRCALSHARHFTYTGMHTIRLILNCRHLQSLNRVDQINKRFLEIKPSWRVQWIKWRRDNSRRHLEITEKLLRRRTEYSISYLLQCFVFQCCCYTCF